MQHLSMLLEHGISMMAQGADLKLQGQAHGDAMLKQSADMLRRAMSGPEMAAMHKGGAGQSPAMQHTHELGAAAFDLLEMMMNLQADHAPKHAHVLHHALLMAAEGANLKAVAGMGMSPELDMFMQKHGEAMQHSSMVLSKDVDAAQAYQQAILKVIALLSKNTESTMQHMH